MYAIVKTGGKQYKVAPGDVIAVEKLQAEIGDEVELPVICVVDGDKVEADPAKAASTKVLAMVLDQFKDKKQLVFKFKKRKGYKKLQGHRQNLTRLRITAVGADKYKKKTAPAKAASKKAEEAVAEEKPAKSATKSAAKAADSKAKDDAKAEKPKAAKTTKAKADDTKEAKPKATKAKTTKAKAEEKADAAAE